MDNNNNQKNDEILNNIGGKHVNNLNEILRNFTDSDFELKTYDESPYIDIDSVGQMLVSQSKKFSVLSINIQSLNAKYDKLTTLITYLEQYDFTFSAICIQETWFKENQDTNLFQIPGYKLIHQGRICSEHGGLIIYLKNEFNYCFRNIYKQSDLWEGLFIDVFLQNSNKKLTIGNIYRPPKFNNSNSTIENFIKEITPIVISLSKESSYTIFTGDFNINLLEIDSRSKYQAFFDLFVTNGFYPKIMQPTRLTRNKGTLIDNSFCKLTDIINGSYSGILLSYISDHLPHFTCLDILTKSANKSKYIYVNKMDEKSITSFYNEVETSIRNSDFLTELTTNPNINYNLLQQIIFDAKEKYLKPKKVKFNHYKHK